MRLVVDLQACETDSRDRGIGRYAMSLVQAIASEVGEEDELVIAIDMADSGRARDVRGELRRRNVRGKVVAYGYPATPNTDTSPAARKLAGQLRARFYASLCPDVLLICSFIETGKLFSTELDWTVLEQIPTAVIFYDLIPLLFSDHYLQEGHFPTGWYRTRLEELPRFDLILSISEATQRDLVNRLRITWDRIAVIGAGFDETLVCPRNEANDERRLQELGIRRPFVLMVGNGDWRKNTLGALRAFANLPNEVREAHELVLTQAGVDVRQALAGEYANLRERVHVLGRVDDSTLALLYSKCSAFYFPSYYEGFGFPVLEAMAFGAPVLASNAGALPEVVRDPRMLFDPNSPTDGIALLERALSDASFRDELRDGVREHAVEFTWDRTARSALRALRALRDRHRAQTHISPLLEQPWPNEQDIKLMAHACLETGEGGECALANGLRAIARQSNRRILVDLTEIVRLDAKTGIQRVTREFFSGLAAIARERTDFTVEPFCWTESGFRYARTYARDQLGVACVGEDGLVQTQPSDLVFMLDSSWWSPERFDDLHARAQLAGGEVVWMVYDLIPIRFPQTCDPGMPPAFRAWLRHAIGIADGFVCISEATRDDLEAFMEEVLEPGSFRPWTRSVHLGCDLSPSSEMATPRKGASLRSSIGERPYFVGLGTLEPRKDYPTILCAFERLWSEGDDVSLVIIGKRGWNVDSLVARINSHQEFGRRLHWLNGGSDGDVRHLLEGAAGLVQASIWEGFGLPLIEAGSLGVPLLVTDIAVFHEIAGDRATYFPPGDAEALSGAIRNVIRGHARGVGDMRVPCRSWADASRQLARILGAA